MSEIKKIGMADLNVTKQSGILTTLGLGSCVGITLYDPITKVAGMAHIMLPSSKAIRNNSNAAKFADTGTQLLLEEVLKLGASRGRLVSKLAGGSQMFSFANKNDIMKIGERNVIAVKEVLQELRIPIVAADTGGNFGRTIELYADSGILLVKTIGHGTKQI
ncbi:chemotaxis protein CheD [Geosporobacter subterraneus DSM 17957]|uniref:Probable chemoreceptor glutamine deamidase CheD n=1 Tax=Geosporobacter subterraneus DSM 17957 TaxID=1121919 RepID=A0A1M6E2K1_9FIRM|nr:chemotaxis protein CheD [Geosporobacter subterraneus]SHI79619.1 chemotaxis protein CheD [Geosporobacter subterraneus DSM 17957]